MVLASEFGCLLFSPIEKTKNETEGEGVSSPMQVAFGITLPLFGSGWTSAFVSQSPF